MGTSGVPCACEGHTLQWPFPGQRQPEPAGSIPTRQRAHPPGASAAAMAAAMAPMVHVCSQVSGPNRGGAPGRQASGHWARHAAAAVGRGCLKGAASAGSQVREGQSSLGSAVCLLEGEALEQPCSEELQGRRSGGALAGPGLLSAGRQH